MPAKVSVHAASGHVAGRPIVCYAQDSSIAAASVGAAEAEVIVAALRHSRRAGVPLVAFLESAGARLQEGVAALAGFGRIFYENVALSGRAPQISVITGTAAGGGCYSPALTDFVVMNDETSMFLTGPKIVKQALGEEVTSLALGGARVHERNGVCDFVISDDYDALVLIRELLGYLPQNAGARPPAMPERPPSGHDPDAFLPPSTRSYYDVRDVIGSLVDGGRFLEVSPRWARNMVVGFARLEGHSVGIVANQARHLGGVIDVQGSQKGAKFVRTCDAFGIPLLVLVDTPGFMPGTRQEHAGVIRHGAELVRAFAAATTPRVTVILRKAFGGAFIAMNSKDLGADAAFAWPAAEIGIMSPEAAISIIHRRQLVLADSREVSANGLARRYAEENLTPGAAVRRGAIDGVIEPADTRERVARALLRSGAGLQTPRSRSSKVPWQLMAIDKRARALSLKQRPLVLWLTGLPGAGKSTIANLIEQQLHNRGRHTYLLDGDNVRHGLNGDLGFTEADRAENIRRVSEVARMMLDAGLITLVSFISPFRAERSMARSLFDRGEFVEIFVEAPLAIAEQRGPKGLSRKARHGQLRNFTGIDSPYEPPVRPEIHLDTTRLSAPEAAGVVIDWIERNEQLVLKRNCTPARAEP